MLVCTRDLFVVQKLVLFINKTKHTSWCPHLCILMCVSEKLFNRVSYDTFYRCWQTFFTPVWVCFCLLFFPLRQLFIVYVNFDFFTSFSEGKVFLLLWFLRHVEYMCKCVKCQRKNGDLSSCIYIPLFLVLQIGALYTIQFPILMS